MAILVREDGDGRKMAGLFVSSYTVEISLSQR